MRHPFHGLIGRAAQRLSRLRAGPAHPSIDRRAYFASKLRGRGLELGALHRPMVKHGGMNVDYVDRLTLDEQRRHYPELSAVALVSPDIIDDAETLARVEDGEYDFLIAAHVIEHMRDPLKALRNWFRVLRRDGLLYLVVPDKRYTFDRNRPRTTLDHLVQDFRDPSEDRDRQHYLEYATLVDGHSGADAIAHAAGLRDRGYSIHFHVFEPADIVALLEWCHAHIAQITIVEGPVKSAPDTDEFHLLVRKQ